MAVVQEGKTLLLVLKVLLAEFWQWDPSVETDESREEILELRNALSDHPDLAAIANGPSYAWIALRFAHQILGIIKSGIVSSTSLMIK